ncbi:hypothetical protein JXA88_03645 [Candidatus Fermentibacteria bacterium]|nr:hypothetical protein [Candidatus Fermentibacteria bacterium]
MTSLDGSELIRRLRRLEAARRRRATLRWAVSAVAWGLIGASVLACIAGLGTPPAMLRWMLLAAAAAMAVHGSRTIGDLAQRGEAHTARALESVAPVLGGRLRPAVDLALHVPVGTSEELAAMAQEQALERLARIDGYALLGIRAPLPWRAPALGVLLVLFLAASSGNRAPAWIAGALPWLDAPPPLPRILAVAPGDTSTVAGARISVRASIWELGKATAVVEVRRPGEMTETVALSLTSRHGQRSEMSAELLSHDGGRQYRVAVGDTVSRWFAVHEYRALEFVDARMVYEPPRYAGLVPVMTQGIPREIRALQGSSIDLTLLCNNPLAACVEDRWRGQPCSLSVEGAGASGRFSVDGPAIASFHAIDGFWQRATTGPIPVHVIPDEPPMIDATKPDGDTEMPRDLSVAVGVTAHDDFGISRVSVRYAMGEREDTLLLAQGALGINGTWARTWDLSSFDLLPEDVVTYRFEVTDNDAVSGRKTTASRWFCLRFPSLEEIVASVGQEQTSVIDSLEALAGEGTDLQEELRSIAANLVGAEATDWGTREDLRALAEAQRDMGERLAQIADDLAQLERKATEEELLTAELLDKVATVQNLLRNLHLPELERALEELQEALDTVNPQELQQALSRLAANQEKILEGLDRAIEMLKQIEAAQRLSSLTRVAEQLRYEQEGVMEAPQTAAQAERQERLGQEMNRLEEGIRQLSADLSTMTPALSESLAAAVDRVQDAKTQQAMEQAAQALRSDSPQAYDHETKALAGLQQLTADLQAAENSMRGADAAQLGQELARAERIVSDLAYEQELLTRPSGDERSDQARQMGVTEALRLLREEMETSCRGVGPATADALGTMARAQNDLDRAGGSPTPGNRKAALRALNTVSGALSALRRDMESMSCAGNPGMDDLFGLSQAQGQLNRSCQSLLPRAGGLPRETLSALAARQHWIRDQLARMAQGQDGRGVTGDLGAIGEEMEDLAEQLGQHGLDEETVKRQRRVLTRLLDAQRSVRRQGLARRRMSEPARAQTTVPGEKLPGAVHAPAPAPPPRRDDPYPAAYHDAIEAYFRALSQPRP